MKRYAISSPSARSDLGRLMDLGFLQQSDDGVRHFFFANDDLHERCRSYLREHCAEAYLRYYDNEGRLRPEFRATDEASALYNRNIGFYEKALLDKMSVSYTHLDVYKRQPIESGYGDHLPRIDWAKQDVVRVDPETRRTILPADWDDEEDDGVYDALA